MKTILLNCSPKGNINTCGSYMISKAFVKDIKSDNDVLAIARSDYPNIYRQIETADHVIFVIPVYVHSVPSFVLDFLYHLPKAKTNSPSIGYILQSGYPESSESTIASRHLEHLTKQLGYPYLGTVIKGECAGLAIMPEKYGKLLNQFTLLGKQFEQTKTFDPDIVAQFAKPVFLTNFQSKFLNMMAPLSRYLGWGKMLKANHAYEQRYDTPYGK